MVPRFIFIFDPGKKFLSIGWVEGDILLRQGAFSG